MPTLPVPTLSSKGLVTQPYTKADHLFSYFLVSQASQTNMFKGHVSSLTYLVQYHAGDENGLKEAVRQSLFTLFNDFFETVAIDVEIKEPVSAAEKDKRFDLRMVVTFNQEGKPYNMARLAFIENSRVINIVNENN